MKSESLENAVSREKAFTSIIQKSRSKLSFQKNNRTLEPSPNREVKFSSYRKDQAYMAKPYRTKMSKTVLSPVEKKSRPVLVQAETRKISKGWRRDRKGQLGTKSFIQKRRLTPVLLVLTGGLFFTLVWGIFFSFGLVRSNLKADNNALTKIKVDIEQDYQERIERTKKEVMPDKVVIKGEYANWQDILMAHRVLYPNINTFTLVSVRPLWKQFNTLNFTLEKGTENILIVEKKHKSLEEVLSENIKDPNTLSQALEMAKHLTTLYNDGPSSQGFVLPVPGYTEIYSYYGWRPWPLNPNEMDFHSGIDFPAPMGTPVVATQHAVVKEVYYPWPNEGYSTDAVSDTNIIVLKHANGLTTAYWHLKSIYVAEGQEVKQGQVIGTVGSTGPSTGPHLHFVVCNPNDPNAHGNNKTVDPYPYLF